MTDALKQQSPTFRAPDSGFMEDNFSWTGVRMLVSGRFKQHYTDCALYFYYCYTSSTSVHQALDLRGWEPLP